MMTRLSLDQMKNVKSQLSRFGIIWVAHREEMDCLQATHRMGRGEE